MWYSLWRRFTVAAIRPTTRPAPAREEQRGLRVLEVGVALLVEPAVDVAVEREDEVRVAEVEVARKAHEGLEVGPGAHLVDRDQVVSVGWSHPP